MSIFFYLNEKKRKLIEMSMTFFIKTEIMEKLAKIQLTKCPKERKCNPKIKSNETKQVLYLDLHSKNESFASRPADIAARED